MLWRDAATRVRPMPSCSILRVLKARMEEDMPAAGIAITNTDHAVDDIGSLARKCDDSRQSRCLSAIAHLMEGELDRGMIALRDRVDRQTLCDWASRYNAEGPDGLKDRPRSGRSPKLDASRKAEVRHCLEDGPGPGVPAWTLGLLKERIKVVFDAVMSLEAVEMNRRLMDICAAVPDGRRAPAAFDGAGWHRSKDLDCPDDISVSRLPPCSPEPDPAESVFKFLKARHFANQVFETTEAVTERVAEVREGFAAPLDRIRSIGHRSWSRLTPVAAPANQGHVHV